jgi:hypothetical protein
MKDYGLKMMFIHALVQQDVKDSRRESSSGGLRGYERHINFM